MKHKWLYAATMATAVIVAPVAADASFKDVKKGTEQEKAIQSLLERKAISGYEDGTFKPGNNVTRSQAAKILAIALNLDTKNVKDPGFKDISKTNSNYKYIAAIANAGLMSGSNGNFNPSKNMTRSQVAKVLTKAYDLKTENYVSMPFSDVLEGEVFTNVRTLLMFEITKGISADKFGVNAPVTRGQLALFMYRIEQYKALPKYDETVTGKSVTLDHVQFEVGQLRYTESSLYNDNIVEPVLEEGGDRITFNPLQEGTAYMNVIGYTPDVDGTLAHVGYQFDVEEVNGELQVTMSALEEPVHLDTTIATGNYSDVELYDANGKLVDMSYQIIESLEYDGYDVQVAVPGGAYKAVLTTDTGEKEEMYIQVIEDAYSYSSLKGQLFTNQIEFDINPDIEEINYSLYGNDSFEMDIDTKPGKLIIHNPSNVQLQMDVLINGDYKYGAGTIAEFGQGYIVSDSMIEFLQTGGY